MPHMKPSMITIMAMPIISAIHMRVWLNQMCPVS